MEFPGDIVWKWVEHGNQAKTVGGKYGDENGFEETTYGDMGSNVDNWCLKNAMTLIYCGDLFWF